MTFKKFKANSARTNSHLCVGLDTNARQAPIADLRTFNQQIVDATAEYAACFKIQLAFYEEMGKDGLDLLENTLTHIREVAPQTPIIGDAKRCDVSHSAAAYARALFAHWGFDCVTLLPYLGADAIRPFLEYAEKSAFVVCHTSNPSAKYIQQLRLQVEGVPNSDARLYEYVAAMVADLDQSGERLGLVMGATYAEQLAALRQKHPQTMLLIPGIGSQAGDLEQTIQAASANGAGAEQNFVVNVSRAIIYASASAEKFALAAGESARYFRDAINLALGK